MPQFGKGNKAAKKEGRLSRNTIQRRERELRKKEKEEVGVDDKEGKASAGARKKAAESVAAEDGKAATADVIMLVASTLIGTMAGAYRPGNCATAR